MAGKGEGWQDARDADSHGEDRAIGRSGQVEMSLGMERERQEGRAMAWPGRVGRNEYVVVRAGTAGMDVEVGLGKVWSRRSG